MAMTNVVKEDDADDQGHGVSIDAKLQILLKDLISVDFKLYSESSKRLVRLFKRDDCGDYLGRYIRSSAECVEFLNAWNMRKGKPGMVYVFSVISVILEHPFGRSRTSGISRNLDSFAHTILKDRLEDIYTELKTEDIKRQSAALCIVASIVKRGMSLASEVATNFDFNISVLPKLSELPKMKGVKHRHPKKGSTRRAFIEFAMSFLEVGNPELLKKIIQQRFLYSGVLQGLEKDDCETLIYILSTIRDRVLRTGSGLPRSLRSVLFGIVTLEQLSHVSGNPESGAANLAHEILVMVCTDPLNGLMPDSNLKGNPKRLLELMKKLKPTEVQHHRNLLLAIVKGIPSLCALYMDVFPYNLEPSVSPLWFSSISLAADLISSTISSSSSNWFLSTLSHDQLDPNSNEVQHVLKHFIPRTFTRSACNKALLHTDILVKHGCLRLLLEILKAFDSLFTSIDALVTSANLDESNSPDCVMTDLSRISGSKLFATVHKCSFHPSDNHSKYNFPLTNRWTPLKKNFQDEIRTVLPDPQVLLKLLTSSHGALESCLSLDSKCSKVSRSSLKRCSNSHENSCKRLKTDKSFMEEDTDIIVSGLTLVTDNSIPMKSEEEQAADDMDMEMSSIMTIVDQIWGIYKASNIIKEPKDVQTFFCTKLLDVLALYIRTIPKALIGSFDFFKILPTDSSCLSSCQQKPLLSLLIEHTRDPSECKGASRISETMYKHLRPLLNLLRHSEGENRYMAYALARSAMLSTGAFDQSLSEVDIWFLFLPGCCKTARYSKEIEEAEMLRELDAVVISFFCDAVSTMGNNLYKTLDRMRCRISQLEYIGNDSPNFSPLSMIIIEKCLRLLDSDSGVSTKSSKTIICLYVSNTLSFLLQCQVEFRSLPALINLLLSEKLDNPQCEWRPLKSLLIFVRSVLQQQTCDILLSRSKRKIEGNAGPLHKLLSKVKMLLEDDLHSGLYEKSMSLFNYILLATSDEIVDCFPLLIIVAHHLFKGNTRCILSMLFLDWNALSDAFSNWQDTLLCSLDVNEGSISNSQDANLSCCNDSSDENAPFSTERSSEDEFAVTAFRSFLHDIPFHFMFTCALNLSSYNEVACKKLLEVLQSKFWDGDFNNSILSLRVVLFWAYQIRTACKTRPSETLEKLYEVCSVLIEGALEYIFVVKHENTISGSMRKHSKEQYLQVAEMIIFHPVIMQSLVSPLSSRKEVTEEIVCRNFDDINFLSKQTLNSVDNCILQVCNKMGNLFIASAKQKPSCNIFSVSESVGNALKDIIQHCIGSFKKVFDVCIQKKDLTPLLQSFCVLHGLIHLMSPFDLLEMVDWMFSRVEHHPIDWRSSTISALSVALSIAYDTFDVFSCNLDQQGSHVSDILSLESTDRTSLSCLLENVIFKILNFSTYFSLELADMCLLKVVDIIYDQCFIKPTATLLPFNAHMLRIFISSPVEIIRHCMDNPNKAKASLLYKLSELSPLHSRLFGMTLFDIFDKKPSSSSVDGSGSFNVETTRCSPHFALTNKAFLLLLPSALSFLTSNFSRGWDCEPSLSILGVYSRILLDTISNWKENISADIFYEDNVEIITRYEHCQRIFQSTLLHKAAYMLQHFFSRSKDSIGCKQRLKIFDSIHRSEGLLSDIDISECKSLSYGELFNVVNKVIGKISFTWLLLFPQESLIDISSNEENVEDAMQASSTEKSKREKRLLLKFMDFLVGALHRIVCNTSWRNGSHKEPNCVGGFHFLHYLEIFILRCIFQLAIKVDNLLADSESVSFVEAFIKSSLLHRFDDPCTLRAIRSILNALKGHFNACEVLELLLGHSNFFNVILGDDSLLSSGRVYSGTFLQSAPSILRLANSSHFDGSLDKNTTNFIQINSKRPSEDIKLELVKLLRFLYPLARSDGSVTSTNTKELLYLLLSGYGASVVQTDLEIFQLIRDLSFDSQGLASIADIDYLWGASALKVWKAKKVSFEDEKAPTDAEKIKDENRRVFRENVVVDAKICAATVFNFYYGRSTIPHVKSLDQVQQCDYMDIIDVENQQQQRQENSCGNQQYDPRFMLQLSNNSLLKGYMEPLEFTRLGLLAIAFVSISSPDEDLRKLGYDVLGSFKKALVIPQKKKDALQLQLLLAYLQNGITEPWQRIPSVIAIFLAEASFILLDTFHDHFHTITKLLMSTRKMNFEEIPLFRIFFQNSSVNFNKERLWILRLIYIGLNLEDDAQIIMSRFVIEQLLSFYTSSLSDRESKILILQILTKSVKLHALACRLVMDCGLFVWLYSVLEFHGERLNGDEKELSFSQIETVLKVILEVIPLKTINQWLKNKALEQMSEISRFLIRLVVSSIVVLKGNISLLNSIFNVISLTMGISLKRKVYHPHFTLSLEGLFQLYEVMDKELKHMKFEVAVEFGLRTLLMNRPPAAIFIMDKAKVAKIVLRAIHSALPSYQEKVRSYKRLVPVLSTSSLHASEESYIEKLLRWVTASVILGFICSKISKTDVSSLRSKGENLQSLLISIQSEKTGKGECTGVRNVNRALAVIILHLQQLLAMKTTILPSVIFSLYLLLLDDDNNSAVRVLLNGDKNDFLFSLCSKIRCPSEFSPAWRWSFYNPWKDETYEQSNIQGAEEEQACQALLLAFSNSFGAELSEGRFLSPQDLENLFSWEMKRNFPSG